MMSGKLDTREEISSSFWILAADTSSITTLLNNKKRQNLNVNKPRVLLDKVSLFLLVESGFLKIKKEEQE